MGGNLPISSSLSAAGIGPGSGESDSSRTRFVPLSLSDMIVIADAGKE